MKYRLPTAVFAAFALLIVALCLAPRDATDSRNYAAQDKAERAKWNALAKRKWPTPMPTVAATPKQEKTTIMPPKIAPGQTLRVLFEAIPPDLGGGTEGQFIVDGGSGDSIGWTASFVEDVTTPYSGAFIDVTAPPSFSHYGETVYLYFVHLRPSDGLWYNYEATVVKTCLTATLALTHDSASDTYTATATPEGGTAPFTYKWTLPGNATDVTGRGNTRSFKTSAGGDVSVTVSDADTPTACTDTATQHICTLTKYSENLYPTGYTNSQTAPRYQNYYQISVVLHSDNHPTDATFSSADSDVIISQFFRDGRGYLDTSYDVWACIFNVAFDFEDVRTRTINWSAIDSSGCSISGAIPVAVEKEAGGTNPPTGCPAGTHNDGTGQCVPDVTTGPQPCATGYHDDGTGVCVADPIEPPPPGICTLDCSFKVDDKGDNLYRVDVTPTGAQGAVAASWKRDGAALSTTALFIEETIARNAEAVFQCTLTDSVCAVVRSIVVRNDDGGTTGPIDPGSSTLGVPDAPAVARDCGAAALVVTSPAFPANAVSVELQRDDSAAIVHLFAAAGAWSDAGAAILTDYRYRCRAVAASGAKSAWGTYSAVANLQTNLPAPVWASPAQNATPQGCVALIATAPPRAQLHADNPLTMKLWGADLPLNYHAKTGQWVAYLDTLMEYQGEVTVALQIRDAAGCYSDIVPLALTINNSIERGARWSEKNIGAGFSAELTARGDQITDVGYYARTLSDGPLSSQRYYRWYVTTPDPGAATLAQLADYAFMRNRVKDWQDIAPDATARLSVPSTSARLAMESLDAEIMTVTALAGDALKVRQSAVDSIEILTTRGLTNWSDSRLTTLALWADLQKPPITLNNVVRDTAKVGDKIYVAVSGENHIIICDLALGKISSVFLPYGETRDLIALENWNGVAIAVYGDGDGATGYTLGASVDDSIAVPAPVSASWVRENRLFLASANNLLEVAADFSLTTAYVGTAPSRAVEVYVDASGSETNETIVSAGNSLQSAPPQLRVGTGGGAVVIASAPPSVEASGLGGAVAGLAHFKGGADTTRPIYALNGGANVARLFVRENGAVTPQWTLADLQGNASTKTIDVARVVTTLRAATGDPLKGGDAGLFVESLVAVFNTSGGGFVARIQEADVDKSKTKRARAIVDQNFKGVGFRPVPVVTP